MSSMNDNALSMAELTDEELTAITGAGDIGNFDNSGKFGNFSSPSIIAFNNFSATNLSFNVSASLNFSHVSKSSYFTLFN